MGTQGIDRRRPLPNQQIACREDHCGGLLRLAFDRYKAHGRPRGCLTNRLGIRRIVLLPLDERLDVTKRDQPEFMAQPANLPAPIVGTRAGFQLLHASRLSGHEIEQPLAAKLALKPHRSIGRCTMQLEDMLVQIDPLHANFSHGRLLCCGLSTPPLWHVDAVEGLPPYRLR